jgi:hypothetical protein
MVAAFVNTVTSALKPLYLELTSPLDMNFQEKAEEVLE